MLGDPISRVTEPVGEAGKIDRVAQRYRAGGAGGDRRKIEDRERNHARTAIARIGGFSALPWQLLGEAQTALRKPDAARVSLRVAVRRDPSSWEAWYDLAVVSHGAERRTAANKALTLNPLGAETLALAKLVRITPSSP